MSVASSSLSSVSTTTNFFSRAANISAMSYSWVDFSPMPEMISGVRASSIRMESTSSTMAKA